MRFSVNLLISSRPAILPINYQYPLSAVIYKIIQKADAVYADFLHNTGYGKGFKLFTFSDLRTPFRIEGDRMLLTDSTAQLTICFHLPDTTEKFIQGLFMHQQFEVGDIKSRVQFSVQKIEAIPVWNNQDGQAIQEVILQPLSPLVCGVKNERGNYDYLPPEHPRFTYWLLHNWQEKYATLYGKVASINAFDNTSLEVLPSRESAKARLITIKANSASETKVKGYVKFRMKVRAPIEVLRLGMNSGCGIYNSMGCGCIDSYSKKESMQTNYIQ